MRFLVVAALVSWRACTGSSTRAPSLRSSLEFLHPVYWQSPELLGQLKRSPFRPGVLHASQSLIETLRDDKLEEPNNETEEIEMPWTTGGTPLAACPKEGEASSAQQGPDANLQKALLTYCSAGLGKLVEFYVDPRFKANWDRLKGEDGWIDKAFVTYMGLKKPHDTVAGEEDLLVQSVHHFSEYPVVVTNFGNRISKAMTPERFPNLVLMHAVSTSSVGKSFNFNKLTAMLFSKVKTGMVLDADQFANHGLDVMLQRAEEETTEDYPYPILPIHWMSRDPEDTEQQKYPDGYAWHFKSQEAPKQLVRWGHAHQTWSHYALPWLAKWTSYVLAPEKTEPPKWLIEQSWLEDEDLLNIALWADGAEKQWCKFDIPGPADFGKYLGQINSTMQFQDSLWYPKGIPMLFFTAHGAKNPEDSFQWLTKLWDDSDDKRKAILYDGQWFGSGKQLRDYDPNLKCLA